MWSLLFLTVTLRNIFNRAHPNSFFCIKASKTPELLLMNVTSTLHKIFLYQFTKPSKPDFRYEIIKIYEFFFSGLKYINVFDIYFIVFKYGVIASGCKNPKNGSLLC